MKTNQLLDPYSYSIDDVLKFTAAVVLPMLLIGYGLSFIITEDKFILVLLSFSLWVNFSLLAYRIQMYRLRKGEDVLFHSFHFFGNLPAGLKCFLGVFFVIIALLFISSVFFRPSPYPLLLRLLSNIQLLFIFMLISFHELYLHRNGIFHRGRRYSWGDLENYAWRGNEQNLLVLQMRSTYPASSDLTKSHLLEWRVSPDQKEQVESILAEHITT